MLNFKKTFLFVRIKLLYCTWKYFYYYYLHTFSPTNILWLSFIDYSFFIFLLYSNADSSYQFGSGCRKKKIKIKLKNYTGTNGAGAAILLRTMYMSSLFKAAVQSCIWPGGVWSEGPGDQADWLPGVLVDQLPPPPPLTLGEYRLLLAPPTLLQLSKTK